MTTFYEACETAIRRSGALLLEQIGRVAVREKGRADLVTEADLASQEVVRQSLWAAFPGHSLISEEDPASSAARRAEYCWILDPLDGTTNYVHQVPQFSVSLALAHAGQLLVAGVYDPSADECFMAEAGKGASLNGKPIHTSGVTTLAEALVAVGFPAVVERDSPDLHIFNELVLHCQAMRRMGSAALNMAYVAAGRFDGCWACETKIWDIAAGALLIREAGGAVTSLASDAHPLGQAPVMTAASDPLLAELVRMAGTAGVRATGFSGPQIPFA